MNVRDLKPSGKGVVFVFLTPSVDVFLSCRPLTLSSLDNLHVKHRI